MRAVVMRHEILSPSPRGLIHADNENGGPSVSGMSADEDVLAELLDRSEAARVSDPGLLHSGLDREPVPADPPRIGLFQDVPRSIWTVFLAGWTGFFLLMWIFFAVNAASAFVVTIAILFGLMAFGLPILMARQCRNPDHRCVGVIDTHTGPVTVGAARVQIALIPVAVVVGLLGFILFAK
jgi:hypothetical protein